MRKGHPAKMLVRWYRRCILVDAFSGKEFKTPWEEGGGSYTGPSIIPDCINGEQLSDTFQWDKMKSVVDYFIVARDEMPHHYFGHFMHAVQILGYKHPDPVIRDFWHSIYLRMVDCLHLYPEMEEHMDMRLGDNLTQWKAREDCAGGCST